MRFSITALPDPNLTFRMSTPVTLATARRSRARNWFFTLNNPEFALDTIFEDNPAINYATWQLEIGESGTEHFQGKRQII